MGNPAYQGDVDAWEKMRDEMLDGKIVAMSPRPVVNHNVAAGNIYRIFRNFLKGKTCTAFWGSVDIYLTEKDRVVPDVMIVCNRGIIKEKGIYGTPDLIVEVLSPSTAKRDRGYKKDLYGKCGVKEYWMVEVATRSIEVYLLKENGLVLDEIYTILPDYEIEDMTEEEKNDIKYSFAPSIFPGMDVVLEDVFDKMI